ncbi:MAG: hypothetical protein Q9202_006204 [Teloschistes flavicans]
MDYNTSDDQKIPTSALRLEDSAAVPKSEMPGPLEGLPLRLHGNKPHTGSPQPSPLSQSISAEGTAAEAFPTASDIRTESKISAADSQAANDEDGLSGSATPIVQGVAPRDESESEIGSMSAVTQGQDVDSSLESGLSGNDSPDARLEKEYHRDKVRTDIRKKGDESKDNSSDENSSSRGRQRNREKKQYRKVASVSASDTDRGSGKEIEGSASNKPPLRKWKTFEPLREKEERAKAMAGSEPTVTITGPNGEKITVKKGPVHPNTNYDQSASREVSPNFSDSEEMRDIRRAQSLPIYISPIDNITPRRVIKTIHRGDFPGMMDEAQAKKRQVRTYFVATDLSEEAAYALEWTIGTILRDGDTLLAIMAINDVTGTGKTGDPERLASLELTEGAIAMLDTVATIEKMTSELQQQPSASPPGSAGSAALAAIGFGSKARRDSDRGSKDSRKRSKEEAERLHAIGSISETILGFLRKTTLQVRVSVEVISCRNPKTLITEAIDKLEPTMVILGSRGRGALKGCHSTLLGSFSNYLVAKSSIPVMVARKKLTGRKAKNVNPTVRLANNLVPTTNSRLTKARID